MAKWLKYKGKIINLSNTSYIEINTYENNNLVEEKFRFYAIYFSNLNTKILYSDYKFYFSNNKNKRNLAYEIINQFIISDKKWIDLEKELEDKNN